MKRILILLNALIVFTLFSCNNSGVKGDMPVSMELSIYDSIDLPDARGFEVFDYDAKRDLFLGVLGEEIVCFSKDKEVFRFNRFGNGPEEYSYSLFFRKSSPRFDTDTSIMINNNQYLKYYDYKGNFIKSVRIDTAHPTAKRMIMGRYKDKYVFQGDNTYTKADLEDFPDESVFYQKAPQFFVASFDSNFTRPYGHLPKESIIMQKNRAFEGFKPRLSYNKSRGRVDILYSADQKLFSFPLDHPETYSYIQLDPNHFTEQQFQATKTRPDANICSRMMALNTYYYYFYSQGDTIMTGYFPGVPEDVLDEELPHTKIKNNYREVINKYLHFYLDVYVDGKKKTGDILMQKGCMITYLGGLNNIIVWKENDIVKNGQPMKRLYFARLKDIQ
ncbi:MAG: hypothetical protein ACEPOV_10980 [Hyphomicrobiales bacterium]